MRDRRSTHRKKLVAPVDYACFPNGGGNVFDFMERGITFDFSDSGLSFFINRHLDEGRDLALRCDNIWKADRVGTVRWCRPLSFNLFKVGVSLY
ncbi:MAG: hypothetical protein Kow0025_15830 [Thermodesulfovibrionales bacterium]